jgi:antitoxin component YwqK of YwqJK toxin-antitoxin module
MRRYLLLIPILFALISCGKKKRKVIEYGTESWPQDSVEFITELYVDHDSAFNTWTDKKTGKLFYVEKSASLQDLKDSTYSGTFYFDDGSVLATKFLRKRARIGNWEKFYPGKKKRSLSKYKDGKLIELTDWWENGNVNVEIRYSENGKMIHEEFFENGNPAQKLEIDSVGTGTCINYYSNGKKRGEGNVFRKNPSGIWKMYDTLGNLKQDTLFGIR